jgi:hypothetical protein
MAAIEHRFRSSCNYKIRLPPNASIHGGSPTKSRDDVRVNLVTMKFTYDCIPKDNGRDERALTEESQPSQSSLPAGKKGRVCPQWQLTSSRKEEGKSQPSRSLLPAKKKKKGKMNLRSRPRDFPTVDRSHRGNSG